MKLTRRDFLKVFGASAALVGIGAKAVPPAFAPGNVNGPQPVRDAKGVLIDTTRCIGCRLCQQACKEKNNLPDDSAIQKPYGKTYPDQLSASTFTLVEFYSLDGSGDSGKSRPAKKQCMNCVNPACVAACTVGALQKVPNGPVTYDTNRCIGCRYCMYACPFGIPRFQWDQQLALIRKCDNCADLVEQGKNPACVQACPVGALQFGIRTGLLSKAHQRINDNPGKYVDHVYGENELGGTSMMYLASVPFEKLGLPALPDESPAEINDQIMHSTPAIASGIMLTLSAIYLIVKRRKENETTTIENDNGGK